jgi:cation diffusion facilitator family transporter
MDPRPPILDAVFALRRPDALWRLRPMSESGYQHSQRISAIGLFVNAGLGVVKLLGGLIGNSAALVADAIESLADVISSMVAWSGLRIARQPPDEDHPYGHGRAESVAALIVSLMLFGAGASIAVQAVIGLLKPSEVPAMFTLWIITGVIVIKESMYQIAVHAARKTGSSLMRADAWHHRSDALTSVAALVGIAFAVIGGERYAAADEWAALAAAAMILFNAWRVTKIPLNDLMDRVQPEFILAVRKAAETVPDVAGIEKILARKSGLSFLVDMHVEVDPAMTVKRAHSLAHEVKNAVRQALPAVQDVLVHIEPHRPDAPAREIEAIDAAIE